MELLLWSRLEKTVDTSQRVDVFKCACNQIVYTKSYADY